MAVGEKLRAAVVQRPPDDAQRTDARDFPARPWPEMVVSLYVLLPILYTRFSLDFHTYQGNGISV
jgi:hypothetical protein